MNNGRTLKPAVKLILILFVVGILFGGYLLLKENTDILKPSNEVTTTSTGKIDEDHVFTIGVVTWTGYAGGQYFNEGFAESTSSRFSSEYGLKVKFIINDDFVSSREAWKAGEIDILWATADAFPTEAKALERYQPKIFFQADKSRGGDAVVVKGGIKKVNDLKGKKVAVAFGTPSHTLLLNVLSAAGLSQADIQIVQAPSAVDAAQYFKAGQVDAAVVWSPDDEDCVATVSGAKVLTNTKQATEIISDVFFAKAEFIQKYKEALVRLVEGWLRGAAEINTNADAKSKAAEILSEGLNQPLDFCKKGLDNVRLCTLGDNKNFFGMNSLYTGITGKQMYSNMAKEYAKINLAPFNVPTWESISTTEIISAINLSGPEHEAEQSKTFTATTTVNENAVYSTKGVSITFATGSSTLDDNAKYIIDNEFGMLIRNFSTQRIRLAGNTDNTGDYAANVTLSKRRAESVANYLISKYKLDRNRFIVVGNGPDNPVADNNTAIGKSKNRRTDLELINE